MSEDHRRSGVTGQTFMEKILSNHLVEGDLIPGEEIGIEIDQVLMQNTTGMMVQPQLETLNLDEAQAEFAAQYCDHQIYQFDFKNTDDHRSLHSAAGTCGAHFSRPGNGICHSVHKENFAAPGKTLLDSDSCVPIPGSPDQLATGTGGLDITVVAGGGAYYVEVPEVVNARLEDKLPEWSSARDIALEILRRETAKGGVGKVFEYTGPGAESFTVPKRATITNMRTELGATSSLFGTDEKTKDYLERQGRGDEYVRLTADDDTEYASEIVIDLSELKSLIVYLSMPDNVVPIREVAGRKVEQVLVSSCTNGGYKDVLPTTKVVKGQEVVKHLEIIVVPSSKQAGEMLARGGQTAEMMIAGANVSEATCGPCIGIGRIPVSDSVSLHTFDHSFGGHSGIGDDNVYLCSPQVTAATAFKGEIVNPYDLTDEPGLDAPGVELPDRYNDSRTDLIYVEDAIDNKLIKSPNIGEVPLQDPLGSDISGGTLLKMEGNITTDHIILATSDILKFRSNIERLSDFTFSRVDETFAQRAKETGSDILITDENYGQGSSHKHVAMCPIYLGIEAVLAQSFARAHKADLFNFGIIPFAINEETYVKIEQGNDVEIVDDITKTVESSQEGLTIHVNDGWEVTASLHASERERRILAAGDELPLTKQQAENGAAPANN